MYEFPAGFDWGTATSAYQIEGAVSEGGRKDSIWDVFTHTPGNIARGDTGDVACDHYRRWKEDFRLMHELGYKAYRFSIAWPRILPDGIGQPNQAGIDFYSRLIDELLEYDIKPLVTLYHWDLPAALPDGWLNRSVIDAFSGYAFTCAKAFGDRVKNWITINEPYCISFLGYRSGVHAPGVQDEYPSLVAAHHVLLAHGNAVPVIRAESEDSQVGIALSLSPYYPNSPSSADIEAARHADGDLNRWFLDPLFGRSYPADILNDYVQSGVLDTKEPKFILPGDMDTVAAQIDFLAINYYFRNIVKSTDPREFDHRRVTVVPALKEHQTDMGWEVYPFGLYETLSRVYWNYRPRQLLVTENGASYSDGPVQDDKVHDDRRIAYLKGHIQAVAAAIQSGIPVTGYYVWSLLDNFEWSYGYSQRFGLIYVDYETQKRIPKDSAFWYANVIRQNGLDLESQP